MEIKKLRKQFGRIVKTRRFQTFAAEQLQRQDYQCFYCRKKIFETWYADNEFLRSVGAKPQLVTLWKYEIEHKTPLCRGGTNDFENIVFACKSCNKLKRRRTAEEFLAETIFL